MNADPGWSAPPVSAAARREEEGVRDGHADDPGDLVGHAVLALPADVVAR